LVDPLDTMTAGVGRPAASGVVRRLVQVYGPSEGSYQPRSVDLGARRVTIGRAAPATFIVDDALASRQHVELTVVPEYGVMRIADLGSKNGTSLNGRPLDGHAEHLRHGDCVGIGESLFAYEELELPVSVSSDLVATCPLDVSLARFAAESLVDRAAPTELPVLIRGPTGAGKEALAHRVHQGSGRSGRLVSVNCAAFTRDLLASELFGHVKGAFSGADADRPGLFQSAAGGTLFLDEFAEMPLDQQPALLRALQEHRIRPVGSDVDVDVDVRLVAATHQDIERAEREGHLRADLLARLAGVVVHLPGLCDRRVEILPLFRHFLGSSNVRLMPDAAESLLLHDWPKNVRELKRHADTVQLFLSEGAPVDTSMLPAELRGALVSPAGSPESRRSELEKLLEEHEGNVAQVARAIGEHRQQVYRWLKAYGIRAEAFRRPKS
jgi:transcriptional regulator of acetoin/glycerol metabolism